MRGHLQNTIPPSLNLVSPVAVDKSIVRFITEATSPMPQLQAVMSNSFGFGGTNASLLFAKV